MTGAERTETPNQTERLVRRSNCMQFCIALCHSNFSLSSVVFLRNAFVRGRTWHCRPSAHVRSIGSEDERKQTLQEPCTLLSKNVREVDTAPPRRSWHEINLTHLSSGHQGTLLHFALHDKRQLEKLRRRCSVDVLSFSATVERSQIYDSGAAKERTDS